MWIECGINEQQFRRLTPAKVSSLIDARKEQIRREDYRAGIVTATIRAALGAKNIDVFDDFPEYKTKKPKTENLGGFLRAVLHHQKAGTKPSGKV